MKKSNVLLFESETIAKRYSISGKKVEYLNRGGSIDFSILKNLDNEDSVYIQVGIKHIKDILEIILGD